MGYLTTFTIYNDGIDLVKKYPEEFAEKIYNGAIGVYHDERQIYGGSVSVGLGCHANLIEIQQNRHADDHTLYIHRGNCVTEVNGFSNEYKKLVKSRPDLAKAHIAHLKQEIRQIQKLLKENV